MIDTTVCYFTTKKYFKQTGRLHDICVQKLDNLHLAKHSIDKDDNILVRIILSKNSSTISYLSHIYYHH